MGDIEAKREARRRKILEHSEKRLQKITGVENKSTKPEIEGFNHINSTETTQERDSLPISENHSYFTEEIVRSNLNDHQYNQTNNDIQMLFQNSRLNEDLSVMQLLEAPAERYTRISYIILLPVIWCLLMSVCDNLQIDTNAIYLNKIFLPLMAFEIYDYYFSPNLNITSSLLSSVLLLSGRPYSKKLNIFIQHFVRIFQDVTIYFFVFLVSLLLINTF